MEMTIIDNEEEFKPVINICEKQLSATYYYDGSGGFTLKRLKYGFPSDIVYDGEICLENGTIKTQIEDLESYIRHQKHNIELVKNAITILKRETKSLKKHKSKKRTK